MLSSTGARRSNRLILVISVSLAVIELLTLFPLLRSGPWPVSAVLLTAATLWWAPSLLGVIVRSDARRGPWRVGGVAVSAVMVAYTVRYVPVSNEDGIWLGFGLVAEAVLLAIAFVVVELRASRSRAAPKPMPNRGS